MRSLGLAFTLLLAACGSSAAPRATTANHGGGAAAWRDGALPPITADQVVLLADQPGAPVGLVSDEDDAIAPREVPDGTLATADEDYVRVDGVAYDFRSYVARPVLPRGPGGELVVGRNESVGDFLHVDVWYVPTLMTRRLLVEAASMVEVVWSDALGVVMHDTAATIIDLATDTPHPVEELGAPSFAPDGTLYYRTMDGGAWRWTGTAGARLGDGAPGTPGSGDLNTGITDPVWPAPVTFGADGAPAWS